MAVLTLWTLVLGAYTWFWLRRPVMPYRPPPVPVEAVATRPEEVPQEQQKPALGGLLLYTLKRVLGRLDRAEKSGNNGRKLKFYQLRTWTLSCVGHYGDSSLGDQENMRSSLMRTLEDLSDDENSPTHSWFWRS